MEQVLSGVQFYLTLFLASLALITAGAGIGYMLASPRVYGSRYLLVTFIFILPYVLLGIYLRQDISALITRCVSP